MLRLDVFVSYSPSLSRPADASFVGPPLSRPLEVLGRPVVTAWVEASGPGGPGGLSADLFAYLLDVDPQGVPHYVTEGCFRCGGVSATRPGGQQVSHSTCKPALARSARWRRATHGGRRRIFTGEMRRFLRRRVIHRREKAPEGLEEEVAFSQARPRWLSPLLFAAQQRLRCRRGFARTPSARCRLQPRRKGAHASRWRCAGGPPCAVPLVPPRGRGAAAAGGGGAGQLRPHARVVPVPGRRAAARRGMSDEPQRSLTHCNAMVPASDIVLLSGAPPPPPPQGTAWRCCWRAPTRSTSPLRGKTRAEGAEGARRRRRLRRRRRRWRCGGGPGARAGWSCRATGTTARAAEAPGRRGEGRWRLRRRRRRRQGAGVQRAPRRRRRRAAAEGTGATGTPRLCRLRRSRRMRRCLRWAGRRAGRRRAGGRAAQAREMQRAQTLPFSHAPLH